MKPKPFVPEPMEGRDGFVRDRTTGLAWHCCRLRTLYADTDRSQVVYHANYLRYFEYGRASLMRDVAYPYREIEESGYTYPIIKMGADFFTPLYYDDAMCIHTRPGALERVKLAFEYVITTEENHGLVCKGFTCHCAVNNAGIPVGIDEKTVKLWKRFPE
ncbi:MAG: YbgC/FadM family acyl-CoA thioesterase [Desulfobacterales bacterium]|nr:YbgC/FadM family acyl-CoA thioesterase [Desulfobacterales bacterium]